MPTELSFPTLKSYLDWRNEKRAEYQALSEYLREIRNAIKQTQSTTAHAVITEINLAVSEERKAKWRAMAKRGAAKHAAMHSSRTFLKQKATAVLQERMAAKKIAGASWTKWRETNQPEP